MRRKAFSLVEMLVVVSIVVLLLSILMPSFARARSIARDAICREHLHECHTAMADVASREATKTTLTPITKYYPTAMEWPAVAYSVVPTSGIFICPETDDEIRPEGILGGMMFVNIGSGWGRNIHIRFDDPAHQCWPGYLLGTRYGTDAQGKYFEVACDDNANAPENEGDMHDGRIRIYLETKPPKAVLTGYSCGEYNCVLFFGKPLFVSPSDPAGVTDPNSELYGWMGPGSNKVGMEVPLTAMLCSYGVNSDAYRMPVGLRGNGRRVLLTDYDSNVIYYQGADIEDRLNTASRHMGHFNTLFTDGSVEARTTAEITPLSAANQLKYWTP